MKMDATLKRRMWKVAIAHFALTVLAVALILWTPFGPTSPSQDFLWAIKNAFFALLQSHFYFLNLFDEMVQGSRIQNIAILFSIPLWSLCFGWLFVKLDNWLNHFPVFGRKIF